LKRFLVISDTHVPVYQRDLPPVIYEIAKEVDGVIALGDFVTLDTVLALESITHVFYGVHGNMDDFDVKSHLPSKKVIMIEGVTLGLTHGWGPPFDIRERIYQLFLDTEGLDVVLYGHTHQPFDGVEKGIRFLNPGTATPGGSYAILTISGRDVKFEIQNL